jgi:hypothetical protein
MKEGDLNITSDDSREVSASIGHCVECYEMNKGGGEYSCGGSE